MISDPLNGLIQRCRAYGIELSIDGDDLLIRGRKHVLTNELLSELKENKQAILTRLEFYEERAAIREHDGGMEQIDAEEAAWLDRLWKHFN